LKQTADILPNNEYPPVYPFGGVVVNFNISTRIHRDWKDLDICIVLVISDCEGGELVLYEPGIVLGLWNGDMVIFTSSKTSHFNLHFKGKHASMVFHTDRDLKGWQKDRNGWKKNKMFKSS
jgi:hypothetical protein